MSRKAVGYTLAAIAIIVGTLSFIKGVKRDARGEDLW